MKIKLVQLFIWFKNLFTKKDRTDNYFTTALKNVKKAAIKSVLSRRKAKQEVVNYVKWLQTGPKKSHFEIEQLVKRKGLELDANGNIVKPSLAQQLKIAGVKTDWRKMQFLN